MDQPILSIIIPVYNAAEYVEEIVDNILKQDFDQFELILINDGSSDNSLDIINNFAKKDRRVIIYSQDNGGPSSARNLGIKHARGKYIQFYDSDDNITPESIKLTIDQITSSKSDILISGWQICQQKPKITLSMQPGARTVNNDLTNFILDSIGRDGTLYNLWNKLFRADIIRKYNLYFREDLKFGEDLLFSLEYFSHINSLQIVPDITYCYQTDSSTSIFSKSSIIPKYRLINDQALIKFVGKNPDNKTLSFLTWVRWRWVLSYWMLLQKSQLSLAEKKKRLISGFPKDLSTKYLSYSINKNKFLLAKIAKILKKHPILALSFAWLLNLIKDSIKRLKTCRYHLKR